MVVNYLKKNCYLLQTGCDFHQNEKLRNHLENQNDENPLSDWNPLSDENPVSDVIPVRDWNFLSENPVNDLNSLNGARPYGNGVLPLIRVPYGNGVSPLSILLFRGLILKIHCLSRMIYSVTFHVHW